MYSFMSQWLEHHSIMETTGLIPIEARIFVLATLFKLLYIFVAIRRLSPDT